MIIILDNDESIESQIGNKMLRQMDKEEWRENFQQLCMHCESSLECEIPDRMIEYRNDEHRSWPKNGWRYCEHSGVTCDSFKPQKGRKPIAVPAEIPPMCQGCAGRPGTPASQTTHTSREFAAAVKDETAFHCHEVQGQICGGWCRAVKAKGETA